MRESQPFQQKLMPLKLNEWFSEEGTWILPDKSREHRCNEDFSLQFQSAQPGPIFTRALIFLVLVMRDQKSQAFDFRVPRPTVT